jgi:hypothetical protein
MLDSLGASLTGGLLELHQVGLNDVESAVQDAEVLGVVDRVDDKPQQIDRMAQELELQAKV